MQKSTNYFLELGKQLSKQKLKDTLIQNSGSFVRTVGESSVALSINTKRTEMIVKINATNKAMIIIIATCGSLTVYRLYNTNISAPISG